VDFTREPIIETIITPKEGYKLVVRSSKGTAPEEYIVDAVEVVSFGHALFFRSMERPKSFLVPVADYEILEVREARMVLKNAGLDRSIKIGGGREGNLKASPHREADKHEVEEELVVEQEDPSQPSDNQEPKQDSKLDKKRDRRRHYRKRRGGKGEDKEEVKEVANELSAPNLPALEDEKIAIQPPEEVENGQATPLSPNLLSSLLQPPPTLISETINRYRENALFKGAFFMTEEEQYKPHDKVQDLLNEDDDEDFAPPLQEPTFEEQKNEEPAVTESTESSVDEKSEQASHAEEELVIQQQQILDVIQEELFAHQDSADVQFEAEKATVYSEQSNSDLSYPLFTAEEPVRDYQNAEKNVHSEEKTE
jgi:hypothetical protein